VDESANYTITIAVFARSEEEAARAIEALSRPMTGLVLEGMNCLIARMTE
jgi:hypothetical protein